MKAFWSGLVCGSDNEASMAKTMSWVILIMIVVTWFYSPGRQITELQVLLGALLGYIFGGKWTYRKHGKNYNVNSKQEERDIKNESN